jgi:hypothetical protein
LYTNLTFEKAVELEKKLIFKYRADPLYECLNIQPGGMAKNTKIIKSSKISKSKKLTDDEIIKIRHKYKSYGSKFKISKECLEYNLSAGYFAKILRGNVKKHIAGPLLGKDYVNG